MSDIKSTIQSTQTTKPKGRQSLWIVRLLGLFLLLLQAGGLIAGGAFYFQKKVDREREASQSSSQSNNSQQSGMEEILKNEPQFRMIDKAVDASRYKKIFYPIGVLIALSSILFFFRFRGGWLMALLLEGVVLYISLSLYFGNQLIPLVYPIMLYGIFMVLFLNSGAVRKAFLPRLARKDEG